MHYVVKNGRQFESKLQQAQKGNSKFDFLKHDNHYNKYYQWQLQIATNVKAKELAKQWELKQQQMQSSFISTNNDNTNGNNVTNNTDTASGDIKKVTAKVVNDAKKIIKKSVVIGKVSLANKISQELIKKRKPKKEYIKPPKMTRFVVPYPDKISSYELDIMKLTAQFAAYLGKSFVRELLNEEPDNDMFNFLSAINPRFQYFQRLVDSYKTILDYHENYHYYKDKNDINNDNNSVERFKNLHLNRDKLMDVIIGSSQYTHNETIEQEKNYEREKFDRLANALIDWQNFSVLETIEFESNDINLVVPGKNIQEIDAILDTTQDVEPELNEPILVGDDDGINDDMEISSDDDDEDMKDSNMDNNNSNNNDSNNVDTNKVIMQPSSLINKPKSVPMPAPKGVTVPDDLHIKPRLETERDLELRMKLEKLLRDSHIESELNQKCPICQELIPVNQLSEHIKIELLDPKWKEQKEALKLRLLQSSFASNDQIARNLSKFKEQHEAQFGIKNDVKTDDGTKTGENEENKKNIPWDGHTNTLQQQKQQKLIQDTVQEQKDKIEQKKSEMQLEQKAVEPKQVPTNQNSTPGNNELIRQQQQQQMHLQQQQMQHNLFQQRLGMPPPPPPMHPMFNPHLRQMFNPGFVPGMTPHIPPGMPPPPPHIQQQFAVFQMQMQQHQMELQRRQQQQNSNLTNPTNSIQPPPPPPPIPPQQPIPPSQPIRQQKPIQPLQPMQPIQTDQPSKKQKLNDGTGKPMTTNPYNALIPETEFLKQHNFDEIKIKVRLPNDTKKNKLLDGRLLTFTMKPKDTIKLLETRIQKIINIPPNHQNLRFLKLNIWLKDQNDQYTLSYYNITNNDELLFNIKVRGGRNKKS